MGPQGCAANIQRWQADLEIQYVFGKLLFSAQRKQICCYNVFKLLKY